jgi:hypothetical protein
MMIWHHYPTRKRDNYRKKCRIPKVYEDLSSHICEVFGLISALAHLIQIQLFKENKNRLTPISANIICDNLSIVSSINRLKTAQPTLKSYYQPDPDVIYRAIRLLCHLKALKAQITMKHVKVHQDKNSGAILDNEAALKVAAHNAATASLNIYQNIAIILPELKARIYINKK